MTKFGVAWNNKNLTYTAIIGDFTERQMYEIARNQFPENKDVVLLLGGENVEQFKDEMVALGFDEDFIEGNQDSFLRATQSEWNVGIPTPYQAVERFLHCDNKLRNKNDNPFLDTGLYVGLLENEYLGQHLVMGADFPDSFAVNYLGVPDNDPLYKLHNEMHYMEGIGLPSRAQWLQTFLSDPRINEDANLCVQMLALNRDLHEGDKESVQISREVIGDAFKFLVGRELPDDFEIEIEIEITIRSLPDIVKPGVITPDHQLPVFWCNYSSNSKSAFGNTSIEEYIYQDDINIPIESQSIEATVRLLEMHAALACYKAIAPSFNYENSGLDSYIQTIASPELIDELRAQEVVNPTTEYLVSKNEVLKAIPLEMDAERDVLLPHDLLSGDGQFHAERDLLLERESLDSVAENASLVADDSCHGGYNDGQRGER